MPETTTAPSAQGEESNSSGFRQMTLDGASGHSDSNHSSLDNNPATMSAPDFSQFDDSEDEDHYQGVSGSDSTISIERIRQYLSDKLGFYSSDSYDEKDGAPRKQRVLETVDIDGVIKHWKNGGFKKIVTMVGAGISTCEGKVTWFWVI